MVRMGHIPQKGQARGSLPSDKFPAKEHLREKQINVRNTDELPILSSINIYLKELLCAFQTNNLKIKCYQFDSKISSQPVNRLLCVYNG